MNEFLEVMKQAKRMCKQYTNTCEGCALYGEHDCLFQNDRAPEEKNLNFLADAEKIVMNWAKEHPEPRYPSWNEAWMQLFPMSALLHAPCPAYFLEQYPCNNVATSEKCDECRRQPIPADIAEKLGIKPMGGNDDGKM